jgi:hypothetical protein
MERFSTHPESGGKIFLSSRRCGVSLRPMHGALIFDLDGTLDDGGGAVILFVEH